MSTLLLVSALFLSACGTDTEPEQEPPPDEDPVVEAFPELTFSRPLAIRHASDQSDRVFVVEQEGVISIFADDPETTDKTVFLDISSQVDDTGNEEGLLGLAFHPDYESNGYFYVNYTASGPDRTVISRFQVSQDNPDQAVPESETELLTFEQPYSNHNGGHLAFGPDGYLYIAVGDGGSAGDPGNNAQDRTTLLGSILRIDVDSQQNGDEYGIPEDNPFVDNNEGYREEIFAWGLRNPWRFSFDAQTGDLWAADVGQNDWEEIHIIESGLNYGWNILEGSHCYPPGSDCDKEGLELPVYEYEQTQGNRSITGGYVYRGSNFPELEGLYIYADYVSGRIWALDISDPDNPENTELYHADFSIPSFGTDPENEIYICGFDGKIYRLGSEIVDQLP